MAGQKRRPAAKATSAKEGRAGGKAILRRERFAEEYVKDLNTTQAAIRSGFSAKTAAQQGSRLLRNVQVRARIDALQAAVSEKAGVDAQRILEELNTIGLSDIGEIIDFSGENPRLRPANTIPERARRAIASIKLRRQIEGKGDDAREVEVLEFRLWSKPEALRDLGRHKKLFTDQQEIIGSVHHDHEHHLSDAELQLALGKVLARVGARVPVASGHANDGTDRPALGGPVAHSPASHH